MKCYHFIRTMKILFADVNHAILHETLLKEGFECDLFWDRPVDELLEILPRYEGLVIRSRFKLTKEILQKCERLRCIGRVGAGMENIDLAYAAKNNIVCVCAPEGNRDAVGEHALGMLLMLFNRLKIADTEVRKGIWVRAGNRGVELKGKTVGIIGFGNTGSAFAKKLSGMDCRILVYDKYKSGYAPPYVKETSLAEIHAEADVLSLHLPLNEETRYFVNAEFLSAFKKNIYVINTSRGPCLNTTDLVSGLKNGKVLGACLDVLEYEAVSFEKLDTSPEPLQYLIGSDNVILSPHIAGWTHESNYKMSKAIAEKMTEVLKAGNQSKS